MGYRKPTIEEINVLYGHLEEDHNIDKRGADLLAKYELPYESFKCPHDFNYIICLLCYTIVLAGRLDGQKATMDCPCIISIPNDVSELTDGK